MMQVVIQQRRQGGRMQKCRKRAEMPGAEKEKQEEIEKRGEEH
jgi:hypothetical protein